MEPILIDFLSFMNIRLDKSLESKYIPLDYD